MMSIGFRMLQVPENRAHCPNNGTEAPQAYERTVSSGSKRWLVLMKRASRLSPFKRMQVKQWQ